MHRFVFEPRPVGRLVERFVNVESCQLHVPGGRHNLGTWLRRPLFGPPLRPLREIRFTLPGQRPLPQAPLLA